MTADLANLVSLDIRSYFELLGRLHCLQTAIKSFEQAFDSKVKSPSYGSIEVVKTTETLKELVENHRPLPSLDLKGYVNTFIGDFSKDDTNIYKDGLIEKYQKGLFTTSEYCMQIQKADAKDLTPSFRFWLANACHHIFYQEKLNPFLSKLSEFASVIPIITELRKGNEEAKTKLRKILGVVDGSHKNIVEKLLKAVIDLLAQNQTIFGSYAEILEPACSALVRRIKEFQSCFEVPNHRPLKMALEVIGSSNEVIRDGVRNQGYDVWYKIVNELQDSNKLEANLPCRFLVSVLRGCDAFEVKQKFSPRFWGNFLHILQHQAAEVAVDLEFVRPKTFSDVNDYCDVDWVTPGEPFKTVVTGVRLLADNREETVFRARVSAPRLVPSVYEKLTTLAAVCSSNRKLLREACNQVCKFLASLNSDSLPEILRDGERSTKLKPLLFEVFRLTKLSQRLSSAYRLQEAESVAIAELHNDLENCGVVIRTPSIDSINNALGSMMIKDTCLPGVKSGIVLLDIDWGDGENETKALISAPHPNLLLQCFAANNDELLILQREDPAWDFWPVIAQSRLDMCRTVLTPTTDSDLKNTLWSMFSTFVKRSFVFAHASSLNVDFRRIASEFYDAFEKLGGKSSPRWLKEKGCFAPLQVEDLKKCEVKWESSKQPAGSILEIIDYGNGTGPLVVLASVGAEGNISKVNLPFPEFESAPPEIREIHKLYQQSPLRNPKELDQEINTLYKSLKEQFKSEKLNWFNDWIHDHLSGKASKCSSLWLCRIAEKIPFFPKMDLGTHAGIWDASTTTVNPTIRFEPNAAPLNTVLYPLDRTKTIYSVDPNKCHVVLSSGPTRKPLLEKCDNTWNEVRRLIPNDEEKSLREAIGRMLLQLRDTDRGIPFDRIFTEQPLGKVFADVVDQLSNTAREAPKSPLENYDRLLAILIDIWESVNGSIIPRRWKFSQKNSWDASWGKPTPSFANSEKGTVELHSFGISIDGEQIVACQANISAGPRPQGYETLISVEKSLRKQRDELRIEIPKSLPLFFETLKKLPGYSVGNLENSAVSSGNSADLERLFRDLHHLLYDDVSTQISPNSKVWNYLKEGFDSLLAGYGFRCFPGKDVEFMTDMTHEVEEWFDYLECGVALDDSSKPRGNTRRLGWIDRVDRPGLMCSNQKRCLVQAKVSIRSTKE